MLFKNYFFNLKIYIMGKKFSLLENEYKEENSFLVYISTDLVQVLRQSRTSRSKEKIAELTSSIKADGQMTEGTIFAFPKEEAEEYLKELNDLYDANHKLIDFSPVFVEEKNDHFYLFLIVGEGRLISCKQLKIKYFSRIFFGRTFEEAIKRQLAENMIREELSQFDAVTSAVSFWVKTKKKNPNLTLKKFSKEYLGKSVSWLSSTLRFARLPISIQEMMKSSSIEKGVNYSLLLSFVSFYDYSILLKKTLSVETLKTYIIHCVSHKYSIKKAQNFILTKRQELEGQSSMFPAPQNSEINRQSLSKIRKERTQDMTNAISYINATGQMKIWITEKCKGKATKVVELIQKEDERF